MKFTSIRKVIEDIGKKYGVSVKEVILFGSFAGGTEREDSDIDIYVVVDRYSPSFHDELYVVLPKILNREVDIVVAPYEIFQKLSRESGSFEHKIKKYGVKL